MISNDHELETTQARIRQFEQQVAQIRRAKTTGCPPPDFWPR